MRRVLIALICLCAAVACAADPWCSLNAGDSINGLYIPDQSASGVYSQLCVNGVYSNRANAGGAITLDGSGDYAYADGITSVLSNLTTDITIACWVKDRTAWAEVPHFVSIGNSGGANPYFAIYHNSDGNAGFFVRDLGGQSASVTAGAVASNAWAHVAGEYRAATESIHLWVNGVMVGQKTNALLGVVTYNVASIGVLRRNSLANYTKGDLDDVWFANAANLDIGAIYSNSLSASYSDTWHYAITNSAVGIYRMECWTPAAPSAGHSPLHTRRAYVNQWRQGYK